MIKRSLGEGFSKKEHLNCIDIINNVELVFKEINEKWYEHTEEVFEHESGK